MRKGVERRLRHDVGAKAKTTANVDRARELTESAWLLKHARVLVGEVERESTGLDDSLIESIVHDLVRRALALRAK